MRCQSESGGVDARGPGASRCGATAGRVARGSGGEAGGHGTATRVESRWILVHGTDPSSEFPGHGTGDDGGLHPGRDHKRGAVGSALGDRECPVVNRGARRREFSPIGGVPYSVRATSHPKESNR